MPCQIALSCCHPKYDHFGIVGSNDINPTSAAAPFGGMQESGLGRERTAEGIEEYLETKLGGFSIQ